MQVKVELLQGEGWLVVPVRLFEWGQCATQPEQYVFLGRLITAALNDRSSPV